jgi:hypothetical protein
MIDPNKQDKIGTGTANMVNEIWPWFGDEYKAYCASNDDYRRLMSWKGVRHGSIYWFPDGSARRDVILGRAEHNRVAKLLGLKNRVSVPMKRQVSSS